MNEHSHLDVTLLAGYLDNLGKAIVEQMLDLYVQQSVVYLQDINQAIVEQSQSMWQECCHKMKGAAGSAGLIAVHAHLVAIEKSTQDWQQKQTLFNELSQLNQTAIDEFTAWLSEE